MTHPFLQDYPLAAHVFDATVGEVEAAAFVLGGEWAAGILPVQIAATVDHYVSGTASEKDEIIAAAFYAFAPEARDDAETAATAEGAAALATFKQTYGAANPAPMPSPRESTIEKVVSIAMLDVVTAVAKEGEKLKLDFVPVLKQQMAQMEKRWTAVQDGQPALDGRYQAAKEAYLAALAAQTQKNSPKANKNDLKF